MNAMNVSPSKPPLNTGSHVETSITGSPKVPLSVTGSGVPQTNHNSCPPAPVSREISLPTSPDKPLDLYVTSSSKHASNGLTTNTESVKNISLPNSLIPSHPPSTNIPAIQTKQNSGKVESTKHELEKSESTKQESVKSEANKQESMKSESTKQESVKSESTKQESVKSESTKQESVKSESTKQESVKSESKKDPVVNDSPKDLPKHEQTSTKQDSIKQNLEKQEPVKPDSTKPESLKQDSVKLTTLKSDLVKEVKKKDIGKKESTKEAAHQELVKSDGLVKQEITKQDLSKRESVKLDLVKPDCVEQSNAQTGSKTKTLETTVASTESPTSKKSTPENEILENKSERIEAKEPSSTTMPVKEVKKKETETISKESDEPIQKMRKRKARVTYSPTPGIATSIDNSNEERKSKRTRLPTQVYQSPIPELQFIAKLNTTPKSSKPLDEKLITFYKNEFLAVRNPEGSFYICQTFQNIHRKSTKIKIRWFTHLPDDIFTPDFCDTTEFDCILTNVQLVRLEKDKWKLPQKERARVDNILKRALDVEKGVTQKPSVTEEHPDGLDLSLYNNEAQLNKRKRFSRNKSTPRKKRSPVPINTPSSSTRRTPQSSYLSDPLKSSSTTELKSNSSTTKLKSSSSSSRRRRPTIEKETKPNNVVGTEKQKPSRKSAPILDSKSTVSKLVYAVKEKSKVAVEPVKRSSRNPSKKHSDEETAVSIAVTPVGRRSKKGASNVSPSKVTPSITAQEKPIKVRNAGSAVTAKINSAAMKMGKAKERQTSVTANTRKK